jgi:hypothetical protein
MDDLIFYVGSYIWIFISLILGFIAAFWDWDDSEMEYRRLYKSISPRSK